MLGIGVTSTQVQLELRESSVVACTSLATGNKPNNKNFLTQSLAQSTPMLALARTAARRINRVPARSFAEIVSVEQNTPSTSVSTNGRSNPFQRIPVREDHGLYAFFRRKSGDDLVGDARFETFESPDSGQVMTGKLSLEVYDTFGSQNCG